MRVKLSAYAAIAAVVGTASVTLGALVPPAAAATTKSIQIAGVVQCNNGSRSVVGVWVNSTAGGSGFATRAVVGKYGTSVSTQNVYRKTVQVPADGKTPTSIRVDVGCGGTTSTWESNNSSSTYKVLSSTLLDVTCANPTASAGRAVRCSRWTNPSGTTASSITTALRALAHFGETQNAFIKTTCHGADSYWSGDCLCFIEYAWNHSGSYGTAEKLYERWKARSLTFSTSTSAPPGALAFYNYGTAGHVNVSVGMNVFVGTTGKDGQKLPIIAYQPLQNWPSSDYHGWTMPPTIW